MTREEAAEHLIDLVAEYVENHYPLEYLVGYESGRRPDQVQCLLLVQALKVYDKTRAVERLVPLLNRK